MYQARDSAESPCPAQDPLLAKVAKLVKHVKMESSRLHDLYQKQKESYERQSQDLSVMKAKAEVNAENQSKLWQQIADLHNSLELAKENLMRVSSQEEREVRAGEGGPG